jgi:eukaryotic-like serine/threonine-protein kinase
LIGTGTIIGHYTLGDRLGAGGMGLVFRARDAKHSRDVAVKVIRPEVASDPVMVAAFLREAKISAGLSHPGIIGIHEILAHKGQSCIVMELLEGQTLNDAIPATGFPPPKPSATSCRPARPPPLPTAPASSIAI